jgi:autotransporter-associated beta strand protein
MLYSPNPARSFVRHSLMLAAATLVPAVSSARTVILASAPNTAPNGASNSNIPATFGDNVSASITNIFDATAGTDGTLGTPGIGLTWGTTASPLGATNANAWQFHTWGGAGVANTGGGALQLDGSRTGSKFNITFTPVINATVKLNSFNFVGDTNADSYQYRVRVVRTTDSQVVFTADTSLWTTATAQNPTNTDPDTWAGAPKVDINFTGTQGIAYRLEIERLDDDSARTGSRVDIAIDNLDFDQLTTVQNDLVWTGALSTSWTTTTLASPKNWMLFGGTEADFVTADYVTFDDSPTGAAHTVDISGADVSPAGLDFLNESDAYTFTGTNGITGNIELIKSGAGSLTLSQPNSHTGRTLLNAGSLVINHPQALQGSTLEGNFGASTHAFGTITTATLGGLSGNADLKLESSANAALALTVGSNNASTVYAGQLTGSGSLLKTGTGRLSLFYDNTFTGGVTVAGGSLQAQSINAFPAGTITSTGGTIEFGIAGGETTIANDFVLPTTGSGNLRMFAVYGAGGSAPTAGTAVRLTGKISGGIATRSFFIGDTDLTGEHDDIVILDNAANDFTGIVYLNRGTIAFTSDAALGNPDNDITHFSENLAGKIRFDADNIVLNSQRAVDLPSTANNRPFDTQAFTGTIAGPVSGTGILVKQGTGKLILASDANTLTGPVNVSDGTLQVDGNLPTSASAVTVAAAGTLAGSGTVQRSVTVDGGTLAPGASVGTLQGLTTLTLGASSKIAFELSDWTGVAGTGYDTITADTVAITATNVSPVTVTVTPQTLANFSDTEKTFTLVSTTGGITGFSTDAFDVDATALPAATAFAWSVQVQGNNLVLAYGDAGTPFGNWASSKSLTGNDALFDADPDGDGIANGIEFVIGGEPNPANPNANSAALLPTVSRNVNGDLVFVFRRADAAASLNPEAEYGTDLAGTWTTAEGGVNGVVINETNDGFGTGIDRVEVTIPVAQAAAGKIFSRLAVSE